MNTNLIIIISLLTFSCNQIQDNDDMNLLHKQNTSSVSYYSNKMKELNKSINNKKSEIENTKDKYSISFGSSAGECLGYCKTSYLITSNGLLITKKGWDSVKYPTEFRFIEIDKYNYDSIESIVKFDQYLKIKTPKCGYDNVDQGVFWFSISNHKKSRIISYDPGEEPKEISHLLNSVNEIVNRYND